MNKKIVIASIVLILGILLIIMNTINKKYDLKSIEQTILDKYSDLNLKVYDEYDISMYFGIDSSDIMNDSLFMCDFVESEDHSKVFDPNELIIVINTKNPDEYYDILQSYIDSNKLNLEDSNKIKLYENVIFKKGKKSVYLIMGSKQDDIKNIITTYYK